MRHRLFAGFGAILFLVTSSALAIAVVISLIVNNSSSNNSSNTSNNAIGSTLSGYKPVNVTQLSYKDLKVGTGPVVPAGATISADYVGALASNGVIFDASSAHGGPQTFPLSGVIAGWQEGIPGMKVGGERELFIPASLAYGSQGNAAIPPNSALVFLVTVRSIVKS